MTKTQPNIAKPAFATWYAAAVAAGLAATRADAQRRPL